jgi:hypothetical protein
MKYRGLRTHLHSQLHHSLYLDLNLNLFLFLKLLSSCLSQTVCRSGRVKNHVPPAQVRAWLCESPRESRRKPARKSVCERPRNRPSESARQRACLPTSKSQYKSHGYSAQESGS